MTIDIEPESTETCTITIQEDATKGPGTLVPKPIRQLGLAPRNVETVHRLALLAEGGAH